MTNAPKSRGMVAVHSIAGKRIDCAASRLRLPIAIQIRGPVLTAIACQTSARILRNEEIAPLMTGRIVMSKKIVNSERTVAGKTKKIVVQTIKTIVAQMDPELPIAPGTIIHETTPQALTCHEAANAASYPRAFRVRPATKMAMTRVGELGQ